MMGGLYAVYAAYAVRKAILYVCAAALILLGWLLGQRTQRAPSAQLHMHHAAPAHETRSAAVPPLTLFPELAASHITALSVSTPERSFQFHTGKQGTVSVNGSRADSDIYSVLLDQITGLPVERHSAFSPQAQDLLLTLIISTDTREHTARFYEGGGGETAHIVLGTDDNPQYRRTSGWRVGTLMMTCEGTRIQDIHGNEQPAIQ